VQVARQWTRRHSHTRFQYLFICDGGDHCTWCTTYTFFNTNSGDNNKVVSESIPHLVAALLGHLLGAAWAIYRLRSTIVLVRRYENSIVPLACGGIDFLLGSSWTRIIGVNVCNQPFPAFWTLIIFAEDPSPDHPSYYPCCIFVSVSYIIPSRYRSPCSSNCC